MVCPRCHHPAISEKIILDADEAVATLVLLDCRTTRTKASLYTRVSKGRSEPLKSPPIPTLSSSGQRLRFSHCDLADYVCPFTEEERSCITAYDATADAEREHALLAAKAEAKEKRTRLLADAERLRAALTSALSDAPNADAVELRDTLRTLTREHARITRLVDEAKGTIGRFLKAALADVATQDMTDAQRFLAAQRAFAKESTCRRAVHPSR